MPVLACQVLRRTGLRPVWPVWAAPVRGTVQLPSELKTGRKLRGYWRLENGIVAIAPPANRSETVVVLSGVKGDRRWPPAR